ncbi:MAG: DUF1501 domain-containing protein, partial [Alphaproteobacteria bacterium]|nr:DUF1501 domain-containing protein [Alphaproteobacteria bacterium]
MRRRAFLTSVSALPLAASSLAALPLGLTLGLPVAAAAAGRDQRILVLVELAGGNDGLNTVVPYADPAYGAARPRLALPRGQVLQLDERLGLHPALAPLMDAWKARDLAVALGLGYPRPNRSHFRSIEIWESAWAQDESVTEGWLSRIHGARGGAAPMALAIGGDAGPLEGPGLAAIVLQDPEQFLKQAERMAAAQAQAPNPALAHLLRTQAETISAARTLDRQIAAAPALAGRFPDGPFGKHLETAAKLIVAGAAPVAIKLTHGGFDTHRDQGETHRRLLGQLAEGLAAFRASLIRAGAWDRVLVMTYAEFGRRVRENGSAGTDHGTAAPHFVLGGRVKGGLVGS